MIRHHSSCSPESTRRRAPCQPSSLKPRESFQKPQARCSRIEAKLALSLPTHRARSTFKHQLARNQSSLPSGEDAMHSAVVALRGGSNISGLKALRADVLRRAVSQLSWLRATFRDAIYRSHRMSAACAGNRRVVRELVVRVLRHQRSNPSIERTHNGGAQCLAPSRVVPPLCAAHVKR